MKFLKTIRFDDSDTHVFAPAALVGEWAVPGGFVFSNDTKETLTGKRRQAFAHGFLGLTSFGWSSFVAVSSIDEAAFERVTESLAEYFVECYGAPSLAVAHPVARAECDFAAGLAATFEAGVVLSLIRDNEKGEIRESFRRVAAEEPGAQQAIWSLFDADGKISG